MFEIRIIKTIHEINNQAWNDCFAKEAENYEYLVSTEDAKIKGFELNYLVAFKQDLLVAAMPLFLTKYSLDTTLQGTGKKIASVISSAFPNLLKLNLACLGSPCTESGIIGFHTSISDNEKPNLLKDMVVEFEKYSHQKCCKLIGIKDIPETMLPIWQSTIDSQKYARVPGMPTAYLDIDFTTVDEYISGLSYKTRKNMRAKLRASDAVRVEKVHNIDKVLPQIMELYNGTRTRSEWQFEELTSEYFTGILNNMPEKSFCNLYYVGDQLLASNLMIHDNNTLIDKFFCMNSEVGRKHNLYFLSWFTNIRTCLESGFTKYQSGQAYYENKLKLGSKLIRNNMYFKHRNILAQGVLKLVAPMFSADDTLEEAA